MATTKKRATQYIEEEMRNEVKHFTTKIQTPGYFGRGVQDGSVEMNSSRTDMSDIPQYIEQLLLGKH